MEIVQVVGVTETVYNISKVALATTVLGSA